MNLRFSKRCFVEPVCQAKALNARQAAFVNKAASCKKQI